jgi:hypothetical protein
VPDETGRLRHEVDDQKAIVAQLKEALATQAAQLATISAKMGANAQPNVKITQNINTQINIVPWNCGKEITITAPLLAKIFLENSKLAEYNLMDDQAKTDPDIAPPFVLEALLELVRQAHSEPNARNIKLNPQRADQALVALPQGSWGVQPVADVTRQLFDQVSNGINDVVRGEHKAMSLELQNTASYVPMMYKDEPEEYVRLAKTSMAAHLANNAQSMSQLAHAT